MACFLIAASYDRKPAGKYFVALAQELSAQGHQVIVINQAGDEKPENCNFEIFNWKSKRPTKLKDAIFLHKLIKRFRPDCVISTFGSVNICSIVGWLNRIKHRVVWYRTMSRALETDTQMAAWKIFLYRLRKRAIYGLATRFIGNSDAAIVDLQKVYRIKKEKCDVLRFLVEESKIEIPPDLRKDIICVGRLHPCKGQETLIRAVALLKDSFPSISVDFIGGGSELDNYRNLAKHLAISENCNFVGSVSSDEVFRRMAIAKVCVVPSLNEALGWVNIEAQSVGTPLVASDVDGIKEVVVNGETGFLVPRQDVQAFAEKIGLLLQNDLLREKFSYQARQHFEDNFSLKHISRHADFFIKLIKK